MIYDRIKNIQQYKGMSDNLDKGIEFLKSIDLKRIKDGKNEIDGENVFANVMSYDTKDITEGVLEAHKKYIDIHIMLEGKESVLVSDASQLEVLEEYVEEKDCMFYKGKMETQCLIRDDYFVICFPNDVHSPGIKVNDSEYVKKMVVKVGV